MNRTVLVLGSLLVLPLIFFLGLSFRSDPRVIESPLIGQPAPEFELVDLSGRTISTSEFKGTPIVLNFWASWCQPCIAEHNVFLAGAREYGDSVRFLGVIYQDEPRNMVQFIRQRGSWGPTLLDDNVEVAIAYGVYGVPETFFIDRDGTIAEKITGPVDARSLRRILGELL